MHGGIWNYSERNRLANAVYRFVVPRMSLGARPLVLSAAALSGSWHFSGNHETTPGSTGHRGR